MLTEAGFVWAVEDEHAQAAMDRFKNAIHNTINELISDKEWAPALLMAALGSHILGVLTMAEENADALPVQQQNPTQKPKREYLQRTAYPDTVAAPLPRKARKPEPVAK